MSSCPTVISPSDVAELIATQYDLGTPTRCYLMQSGLNDTYGVEIGKASYAFRVNGTQKWWISRSEDLRFELDLLNFLHAEDIPVSYPLAKRDGEMLGRIEGEQNCDYSLFSWAPGIAGADTEQKVRVLGQTLASVHLAADRFHSPYHRYALDEHTLLDRFVREMEPTLAVEEPADALFIREQIADIRRSIRAFDPGHGGWGLIHGDIQELNFHFTPDDQITLFDFDLCGYGWRVYDISYYVTRISEHLRLPFLEGYESVRRLNESEREMIPPIARLAWIREGLRSKELVKRLNLPYMSFS